MIRLCEPEIDELELKAVTEVLKSGYLVQGKYVQRFEERIEEYLGVEHAIAVSNGTAALHLALISSGIGPGDEVLVPDFTFPATANAVELVGAKPIFIDICLDTCNIDTTKIESRINKKTKAIIPVHEFGLAANLGDITAIGEKHGICVIEDAACALGTKFSNYFVGTKSNIGCFSLHPRKAITTGEGGIITTNNNETASKIRILRNHGISSADKSIDFITAGFNYRLTDIQGAIGCAQIDKLDSIILKRTQLASLYFEGLKENKHLQLPVAANDNEHIFQTYHVIVDDCFDRDTLIRNLKESGIECNYGAYSLHTLSYYRNKYSYDSSEYTNSLTAYKHGLALPLHSRMSQRDAEYVIDKVNSLTQRL